MSRSWKSPGDAGPRLGQQVVAVTLVCDQGVGRIQELRVRHDLEKQSHWSSVLLPKTEGPSKLCFHPPYRRRRRTQVCPP